MATDTDDDDDPVVVCVCLCYRIHGCGTLVTKQNKTKKIFKEFLRPSIHSSKSQPRNNNKKLFKPMDRSVNSVVVVVAVARLRHLSILLMMMMMIECQFQAGRKEGSNKTKQNKIKQASK